MTLSVKPFGCMPSAGVSDGVQSAITEKFPGTIFCPVETSGDGRVNFYSRVQMYLFKAKQAAIAEYERALEEHGVTREQVQAFLEANPRFASALHKAPHALRGHRGGPRRRRWRRTSRRRAPSAGGSASPALAKQSAETARKSPHMVVQIVKGAVEAAPDVAARVKEDVTMYRELRRAKKSAPAQTMDAAAE